LRFGKVIVEQSADLSKFEDMIAALNITPPVIIKPNWGTVNNYTEAKIIDMVLSAVDGESIVVESYGWARTQDAAMGRGRGSILKDDLRKSDSWFLDYSGIKDVLKKHSVEYLNITEESWAGRTVDKDVIRKHVEKMFSPVQMEEMYSQVPTRLFEMRGGTLLSLAKYKVVLAPIFVSLSLKNLYGMIPGPSRDKFHGENFCLLDQTIVDLHKIYRSLFDLKGMVDAVLTASIALVEEEAINPKIVKDKLLLLGSENCVELDAFVAAVEGMNPNKIRHVKLAAEHFGAWDEAVMNQAGQSGLRVF